MIQKLLLLWKELFHTKESSNKFECAFVTSISNFRFATLILMVQKEAQWPWDIVRWHFSEFERNGEAKESVFGKFHSIKTLKKHRLR